MLYQAKDRERALQLVAGDFIRGFTLRTWASHSYEEGVKPLVLVDDEADPRMLVALAGANAMVYGAIQGYIAAMRNLLEGQVEAEGGFPHAALKADWEREGRRYLFINSSPFAAWRAAVMAGFDPADNDCRSNVAYMWHIQGEPRFASQIQHSCRMVEGQELFELMKLGIGYDPEGHYVRLCLEHGPSFVCEDAGEPVCWSCTHLNGTMGMIYTPAENRRKGYARSLAALQIDTMLERDRIACAHVIDHNVASMNLIAGYGARRWEEPVVWRSVYWPGEAPPPSP